MARLDLRCKAEIPVRVQVGNGGRGVDLEVRTRDIGLNGIFLYPVFDAKENQKIRLRASFDGLGECEIEGKILRVADDGIAVKFLNHSRDSKWLIWNYLKRHIHSGKECLYCHNIITNGEDGRCEHCGMIINFDEEDFLLTYEEELLSRWKAFLDEAIEVFLARMEALKEEHATLEPEIILKRIDSSITDFLEKAEIVETNVSDKSLLKILRYHVLRKTEPVFSQSYCFTRARTWPQGQQGDYKTLECAYRKMPLSEGLGYYLDYYILHCRLGEAIRNRIKILSNLLENELLQRQNPRILNIACGSCRELYNLTPQILSSGARITCIDSDEDALSYAFSRLELTGSIKRVTFKKYNALRMFDHELNLIHVGMQDVIYSVGLFDYLETDFLIKLFNALYRLLNPGGRLIAAFKDASRYRHTMFHWLVDWDGFKQRTEEDFRYIIHESGIPDDRVSMLRDSTGAIIFYLIDRE